MQRKRMDPSLVTVIVKLIQHINIIPNKKSMTFLNRPLHCILLQNKSIIPQCLLMHAQHLLNLNLPASKRGLGYSQVRPKHHILLSFQERRTPLDVEARPNWKTHISDSLHFHQTSGVAVTRLFREVLTNLLGIYLLNI